MAGGRGHILGALDVEANDVAFLRGQLRRAIAMEVVAAPGGQRLKLKATDCLWDRWLIWAWWKMARPKW